MEDASKLLNKGKGKGVGFVYSQNIFPGLTIITLLIIGNKKLIIAIGINVTNALNLLIYSFTK